MKFLKKLCERILDWLVTGNMVGYVILLAGSIILGLLFDGKIILDKVLGRVDTPWRLIIGSFLALVSLFATWLIEEGLAEQTFKFKRRDKYLCGAIGGLVSALLIKWTWQAALVGLSIGILLAALMRWLKYFFRNMN